MSLAPEAPGPRLVRNTVLNLFGQLLPLLVGVATLPVIVRHLGDARFGVLGLVWAVHGYMGVLDLGLGRATTKYVAELLARGGHAELRRVATLSVAAQTALSLVGAGVLALATPTLVEHLLGVPEALRAEGQGAFYALAASVPFVVLSLSLRAILEAAQRFDLVNLIRTPTSAAMFLVPAVAAPLGASLPEIVLLLLTLRIASSWATAALVPRAIPGFRWDLRPSWSVLRPLMRYGGWVTVSNVVNPVLVGGERFILAGLAGVAAVAYYAAPYEAVTRLLIVPASLTAALFPALSVPAYEADPGRLRFLVVRAHRIILLALALPLALLAGFAADLIGAWLGPEYAASVAVTQILLVGVLVNSVAQVPSVYLLGQGRPDLPARFHLLELPLYLIAAWALVTGMGVTGAALAWSARVIVDGALLWAALCRVARIRPGELLGSHPGRALITTAALALAAAVLHAGFGMTLATRVAVAATVSLVALWCIWRYVADDAERARLQTLIPFGRAG